MARTGNFHAIEPRWSQRKGQCKRAIPRAEAKNGNFRPYFHDSIAVRRSYPLAAPYTADQDSDAFARIFQYYPSSPEEKARMMTVLRQQMHYSPMMQFILSDEERRLFWPQRYCFCGSIDGWISIGVPDTLAHVVKTYVKHLGKASYFELFSYS